MGKTIGVISLKGGVGKTSTVVALGDAIANFNKKVLLIDGNFSAPNLGLHLNVVNPKKTLHHVLNREINPIEAINNFKNFDFIPASIFNNSEISPLKLKNKIGYFKKKYDIILIDSSPSLNDETLAVILASDQILVVTTPDLPTLSTTLKAVKLAKQRGTPIIGLILNKVYNKNFEISIKEIENLIELPVMAVVPHDIHFAKALAKSKPYTSLYPNSNGSEEYNRLAALLLEERYKPVKLKRFFKWVNPKKQDINREIYYKEIFQ
jgi:septum site-determining protein MinD